MNEDKYPTKRLIQLEERILWQEHIIEALQSEIHQLNQKQARQEAQLKLLYQQLRNLEHATTIIKNEPPPHY